MNEKTAGSSGSSDTKDQDDMQEFLEMLKTQFKGSRCYLGQYESPNFMPQASEGSQGDKEGSHSPAVGSVVVTLEPRKKLTLGAFLTGGADQAWQFWEGEFGPSELAAHRNSLGWDGHSLKTFADCFSGAVAGVTQLSKSQPCPAEGDATPAAVVAADEHQQRPPEFSEIGDEGGVRDSDENGLLPGGGEEKQPGAAATGTLDLHYAGAGIVGSWEIRRVQGGVSAAFVDSMHRSIRAAAFGWQSTDAAKDSASGSGSGNSSSSSRAKSSGLPKAKRKRFTGKGATLIGAQSSAAEA